MAVINIVHKVSEYPKSSNKIWDLVYVGRIHGNTMQLTPKIIKI